ncbi:hypothetical protein AMTR_s00021p00102700 [Amborella trichopoda]|uniref:Uncharacterized protein n=1 Tax=Amborella trichopoda TaxID=13333 RepID=W1Q0H3_AMBTC|nr:hypothetical protein AMTR_s00021p00102700 [Amborella trichopoda]
MVFNCDRHDASSSSLTHPVPHCTVIPLQLSIASAIPPTPDTCRPGVYSFGLLLACEGSQPLPPCTYSLSPSQSVCPASTSTSPCPFRIVLLSPGLCPNAGMFTT